MITVDSVCCICQLRQQTGLSHEKFVLTNMYYRTYFVSIEAAKYNNAAIYDKQRIADRFGVVLECII